MLRHRIGGVMFCVLHSCGRSWIRTPAGSRPKILISCFSAKHAGLRGWSKFVQNHDNVYDWSDIYNIYMCVYTQNVSVS